MRTTIDIDQDVLQAAKEISRRQKRTAGSVLSELAREGLRASGSRAGTPGDDFLGFEPIASGGTLVTQELVEQLLDEDDA